MGKSLSKVVLSELMHTVFLFISCPFLLLLKPCRISTQSPPICRIPLTHFVHSSHCLRSLVSSLNRALFSYNASPDDPNEISFNKGEILQVMDNGGKWWSCRTPAGTVGSESS